MPNNLQFLSSILLMIATTSLWAVAFVVPVLVPDASASNIALGRYLVYGVCSLPVLYKARNLKLKGYEWTLALGFAIFGNLLYYFVLTLGIKIAGPGLAVPIIGLLPVTVSLFGNFRSHDLPFRALALPLSAVLAGLLLVNVSRGGGDARFSPLGIACLILPVVMWTWYAVANAAFLKRRTDVSASEWASVIGVATFALTIPLLAAEFWLGSAVQSVDKLIATGQLVAFCVWSVVLGAGASWGAAALFNKASAHLPVALTGQLIIFETIFGVAYVFLTEGRPPKPIELVGFTLAILGTWLSIRILRPGARERLGQEADLVPITSSSPKKEFL